MADRIIMPKQGLQMTEGTIIKWLKKEGEAVKSGEPLFEMETDKLTITIDSTAPGTLLKIVRGEGEVVPITELIAVVGEEGEDVSPFLSGSENNSGAEKSTELPPAVNEEKKKTVQAREEPVKNVRKQGRIFITPRAKKLAEEKSIDYTVIPGSGGDGLIIEKDIAEAAKIRCTPAARGAAAASGISLSGISGSGEGGKIMRRDITAAANIAENQDKVIDIAGMRKVISDNMMNSLHNMAQANHKVRVDMTQAALIRAAFKKADKKLSYNDIIIMALCRALREHPRMNAITGDGKIYEKASVNIGVAVALPNGLIVPTVQSADKMTLQELHDAVSAQVKKAQSGGLTKADYSDGTFTVTNLGMYGLDEFTAIINPPQVGILAVGKIADSAEVQDGRIVVKLMVTLSLTYDHRVIDGAPAAEFLMRIKELLENPYIFIA